MKIGIRLFRSKDDVQENQAFENCINEVKSRVEPNMDINLKIETLSEIFNKYFNETVIMNYISDIKGYVNTDLVEYSDAYLRGYVMDWIAHEVIREVEGDSSTPINWN